MNKALNMGHSYNINFENSLYIYENVPPAAQLVYIIWIELTDGLLVKFRNQTCATYYVKGNIKYIPKA